MPIELGIRGTAETVVAFENTAAAVGSGLVPVFSTPSMIALMENSAVNALASHLPDGKGSVGTFVNVTHEAATPIGMKVWAQCELSAADGRALTFSVTAYDEHGVIGRGTHGRFLIDVESFLSKVKKKADL